MREYRPILIAALITALGIANALSMAPIPKPNETTEVEIGKSAPFVGAWSVRIPTREVGVGDTDYAICALPVRISAANETHIFYLGPSDREADAAMELIPTNGGAKWEPIAGGPSFFAFWTSPDTFYLYDTVPETDADWDMPYIYSRCD